MYWSYFPSNVPLILYCTNVKWRILEPEDILLSRIHIQNTLNPVSGLVYCIVQILYIINYYVIKWSNFATHTINKTPLDATRRHTSRVQSFFRKNSKLVNLLHLLKIIFWYMFFWKFENRIIIEIELIKNHKCFSKILFLKIPVTQARHNDRHRKNGFFDSGQSWLVPSWWPGKPCPQHSKSLRLNLSGL